MATENKMFMIDTEGTKASNTTHTITGAEATKYVGFALEVDTTVSFNSGGQAFPLKAGVPMGLPGNTVSIELGAASKLYLGY